MKHNIIYIIDSTKIYSQNDLLLLTGIEEQREARDKAYYDWYNTGYSACTVCVIAYVNM